MAGVGDLVGLPHTEHAPPRVGDRVDVVDLETDHRVLGRHRQRATVGDLEDDLVAPQDIVDRLHGGHRRRGEHDPPEPARSEQVQAVDPGEGGQLGALGHAVSDPSPLETTLPRVRCGWQSRSAP